MNYQPVVSYVILVAALVSLLSIDATRPYFHFLSFVLVVAHSWMGHTLLTQERHAALTNYSPLIIFFANLVLIALAGFSSRTADYEMGFMVVVLSLVVSLTVAIVILFRHMASVAKDMSSVQTKEGAGGGNSGDVDMDGDSAKPTFHSSAYHDVGLWPVLMYLALFYVSTKYGTEVSDLHYALALVVVPQITAGVLGWFLVRIKKCTVHASFRVVAIFALIMACITTAITLTMAEQKEYALIAYVFSVAISLLGSIFYAVLGTLLGRVGHSVSGKPE